MGTVVSAPHTLDCNSHFPRPLNSVPRLVVRQDRLDQNARCPEL